MMENRKGVVYVDTEQEMERALKANARPIELSEAEYYNEIKHGTFQREKYTFANVVIRFRP